ncbi:MAG TPA: phage major capsid protein, partial [Trebonia sp.]|nr:phage major capsid protein [Trebonia sp.]
MSTLTADLEERRDRLIGANRELLSAANAARRGTTSEEDVRYGANMVEIRQLNERLGELGDQAAMDERARRSRAAIGGGVTGDALEIRSANRLQRGQGMREFLSQRIADERMARGGGAAREFSAGAYFRGMATGQWDDNSAYERRALAEGSVAGGGALVPLDLYSDVVDIVRNSARVLQAGATIVPLSHNVTNVAKLTADPQPAWRAEGSTIAASGSTFSRLTFTTQTLASVVVASRELLEDVPTLGNEIKREMGLEFALGLDLAALYGTGHSNNQPFGLKDASWAVPQTSMGTNGATLTSLTPNAWMGLVNPAYRLVQANENGLSAAIMAPRSEKELVTAPTTINTFAEPPSRLSSIARYGTGPLEVYSTNQIPTNLTVGTGTTCSDLFVGDWSQLLVGLRTEKTIDTLNEAYAG